MRAILFSIALLMGLSETGAASPLGPARQLTFEGLRAGEGYFSADGSRMIFQSEREPGNPFYQMYLMDLETGDVERISTGIGKTTCGWIHPSGERALFASTHEDPEAWAKMVAENAFRESGQTRRYAWDYDPSYDITEVDLATGAHQALAPALGYDAEGAYSPDGTRIVFASNRHAYAADADIDPERLDRDPAFYMDLYVMNADGTGLKRLTDTPGYDGGPFWSADGERITWRRFSPDGARAEIFTMAADGSGERQITDLGVMSWAPFFHPSGAYIVFATNLQGFANFELYLVDAMGRHEPVRVTEREGFDGLATFAPDGKTLSWTSNGTPQRQSQIFLAPWDHEAALELIRAAPLRGEAAPGGPMPEMDRTVSEIRPHDVALHATALASEAMEGRLTGTPGEAAAADYIAEALRALGLQGAGDGGGYTQSFDFTGAIALAQGNALEIAVGGEVLEPVLERDWRPLAFSQTGAVAAAGAVFVGYGLVAPATGDQPALDSYDGAEVAGRWVVHYRGLPAEIDPERRSYLARFADQRYRAAIAKARGALGVISVPPPRVGLQSALPPLSYEAGSAMAGLPVVALGSDPAAALLDDLPAELAAAADAGRPVAAALEDVEVAAHIALTRQPREGRNVLARLDLDGLPDTQGRPPLLLGAHFDHLGRGETSGSLARPEEAGQIHFGADDNASGVAAVLEVAQYLAGLRAEGKLDGARDIVVGAWSGEELGLLGVSHFVAAAKTAADTDSLAGHYAAYLNLDMVGRLRDRLVVSGLASSPVWAREIERRNAVVGLPITTSDDTYLPTDATALYLAEVPILSFFTGAHPDYHTPRDTVERLNMEGIADVARLVALIARGLAIEPEDPAYVAVERPLRQGTRRMGSVFLGTIPDYATEGARGVPISGVVKGGPAAEAGLVGGDVITGLAGSEVETIYDYVGALNGLKPGEPVEIIVERDGTPRALEIIPGIRE